MLEYGSGDTRIVINEKTDRIDLFAPTRTRAMNLLKKAIDDGVVQNVKILTYREKIESTVVYLFKGWNLLKLFEELSNEPTSGELKEAILSKVEDQQIVAAGVVVFCIGTQRFLLQQRAKHLPEGGKIACFAGRSEAGEMPEQTVCREALEEGRFRVQPEDLVKLTVFESPRLKFHSYLCIVRSEFTPKLSNESEQSLWCPSGEVLKLDLLAELRNLFEKDPTLQKIMTAPTNDPKFDFVKLAEEIIQGA